MTARNALKKLTLVANLVYPRAVHQLGGNFFDSRGGCVSLVPPI
jgi:hypothetical protein